MNIKITLNNNFVLNINEDCTPIGVQLFDRRVSLNGPVASLTIKELIQALIMFEPTTTPLQGMKDIQAKINKDKHTVTMPTDHDGDIGRIDGGPAAEAMIQAHAPSNPCNLHPEDETCDFCAPTLDPDIGVWWCDCKHLSPWPATRDRCYICDNFKPVPTTPAPTDKPPATMAALRRAWETGFNSCNQWLHHAGNDAPAPTNPYGPTTISEGAKPYPE